MNIPDSKLKDLLRNAEAAGIYLEDDESDLAFERVEAVINALLDLGAPSSIEAGGKA